LSQETIIECKQSAENNNLFELPMNENEDDEKATGSIHSIYFIAIEFIA
jgi:hypothetical protein